MSEQAATTATAGETTEPSTEGAKEFEAITSQEDFDKAIQARIARERAKIPTDYEELKAQAAELAQIREANKTEAEKAAERTAELERENAALKSGKTLAEVAATKGVPTALIAGPASNSPEDIAAFADALIQFKSDTSTRLVVAGEGKSPNQQPTSEQQAVKSLFSSGD